MNFWMLATILVVLVAGAYIGYTAFNTEMLKAESKGYSEGQSALILQINQNSVVPVISYNNQTNITSVKNIPIAQICGGQQK
jgi:hypothetical protein